MKRKGMALLLAAVLLWTLNVPALGAWYDDAVQFVTAVGLMTGTPQGFEPEGLVTRATVFQTLYNMEGRPETQAPTEHLLQMNEAASGISGSWWTDAARWAYAQGLTTGGFFDGDRVATRSEIVTILYRHAQMTGVDVSIGEETNILTYEDAENVPAWAVPAFQWAVGSGVVSGKGGALLAPNDSTTRAELAQLLGGYVAQGGPAVVLTGQAASINKYGDVVTTITIEELYETGVLPGDILKVTVGDKSLKAPWVTHYDDVAQGQALVLVEDGALRLCLSRGDFATAYGVGSRGDSAVYELVPTALSVAVDRYDSYAQELETLGLGNRLSLDRSDYDSDETFANFRGVTLGNIAPGVLYRSASPIETVAGRNPYADRLLGQAGVNTIVDMADCRAKAPKYDAFAGTNYEKVHQDDGVVYLNMGSDMYVQVGLDDLRNGLDFMTERPGPYLIHSTYGADRTGHLIFLLEALMGADVDDIVDDYMVSFENLYHIEPGTDAWAALAQGGIEADILRLLEAEDMAAARDLARSKTATGATMLEYAAQRYLVDKVGLTETQVQTLKDHLASSPHPAG